MRGERERERKWKRKILFVGCYKMKGRIICMCISQWVSGNMASPAIFQDVNFISTYVYLRRSRRKSGQFNACVTSIGRPGTPPSSFSPTSRVFLGRKVAPLYLLVVARFEDICLFLCACSPSRGSPHPLAMLFFHLFSGPALYLSLGHYRRPLRRGIPARGQFY